MNLFFRLLRILFTSPRRARTSLWEETVVRFRVWPTDLDPLLHMNNGKYFSLMDLGRVDMMIRTGLARELRVREWYPVIASETMRFKQSLEPFQRFELRTKTLGWDDRSFYLRQTFMRGDTVIGIALIRARFLAKNGGGSLLATDVAHSVSPNAVSPPLPAYITEWQNAEQSYSADR
jgi:acyl-CoA thioesterase FadM